MEAGYSSYWDMALASDLLPDETRAYVPKLLAAAILAKHPEEFGFRREEIEPQCWIEPHLVTIPRATSLATLAEAAGVTIDELRDLNPELLGPTTPPRPYALRIPRTNAPVFAARWSGEPARNAPDRLASHRVKRGETLWSLSRRLGVTVQQLATWNGIEAPERHNLVAGRLLAVSASRRRAPSPSRK